MNIQWCRTAHGQQKLNAKKEFYSPASRVTSVYLFTICSRIYDDRICCVHFAEKFSALDACDKNVFFVSDDDDVDDEFIERNVKSQNSILR